MHFYADTELPVLGFQLEACIEVLLLPRHGLRIPHLTSVGVIFAIGGEAHPVVELVGGALPLEGGTLHAGVCQCSARREA